jgi:hypothetical protein
MPSDWTELLDSTQTVAEDSTREALFYANRLAVAFDDSTSGQGIRAVLAKYDATIVGGFPELPPRGAYIVRITLAEQSFAGLEALVARMTAEPGVSLVLHMAYRDHDDMRSAVSRDDCGPPPNPQMQPTSAKRLSSLSCSAPLARRGT